jgi:hypothetical protein
MRKNAALTTPSVVLTQHRVVSFVDIQTAKEGEEEEREEDYSRA